MKRSFRLAGNWICKLARPLALAAAVLFPSACGVAPVEEQDEVALSREALNDLPDLVPQQLAASCVNGGLAVTFRIANVGAGAAGVSQSRVFIDGLAQPDLATPPLGAGTNVGFAISPPAPGPGPHTLAVRADATNLVVESNETNLAKVRFGCP